MKSILIAIVVLFVYSSQAQQVQLLAAGPKTSLRGLSVVNDHTVWVSGSSGKVGRSIDGGNTWEWMTVSGFEKTDFRDIEAFSENTALIMGIAEPAHILRTTDGGKSWQVVFENSQKGMFLDAMDFFNDKDGMVIGDPINNHFFLAKTSNGGKSWQTIPEQKSPKADSGEACFASSGTNIRMRSKTKAVFITGGLVTNVVDKNSKTALPLLSGKESTGANSIALKNKNTWMVVGGDFTDKDGVNKNAAIRVSGGNQWTSPTVPPTGYRSAVEFLEKKQWITCGLNGVDITNDDGNTFTNISKEGFHVVRKAKKGKAVFFAGNGGRIGKLLP
jgi:photosystem II stability/assembly factor-like uncharacterized protein